MWVNKKFCSGLRPFGFLLDRNALRLSLHLAESVVREIQKTKRSVIVLFYLLLVASLRFSLVYLCVQFVFSAAALKSW